MTKNPDKRRVCLYVRVSTTEQAEKFGKNVQLSQMKKWLAAHEDQFTHDEKYIYIDEGFSGASEIEERENLPKLFEAAKKNKFDVVLVWKLDRFFRRTRYLLNAIEELREMGVDFIATSQAEVNTTTTFGKFMLGLLGIIAEMERDLILERTGIGRIEAATAGKWVGGMHTYGYDIDPQKQTISINPETSKIVRKIFNWLVKDRLNTYEIQQRLNAKGDIPTQADLEAQRLEKEGRLKGKKRTKNPANYWHDTTVGRILRNEAYKGYYYYGKTTLKFDPVLKKKREHANPPEEWIKITCPKIVDEKIWEKAQKILNENKRTQKRGKEKYLLSGKVSCERCKSSYTGYMKPKIETINGVRTAVGKLPQYRCRKKSKSKASVPCDNREISGTVLERGVWGFIEELLSDPKAFLKKVEQEERKRVNTDELEQKRDEIQAALEALIKQKNRMVELYELGYKYQGKGELEKAMNKLKTQIERLEADLEGIASQLMDAEDKRDRLASAKHLAKSYAKSLKNLDFPTKRRIIQDIVKRIQINGEDVTIELMIPNLARRHQERHSISNLYGATGQD